MAIASPIWLPLSKCSGGTTVAKLKKNKKSKCSFLQIWYILDINVLNGRDVSLWNQELNCYKEPLLWQCYVFYDPYKKNYLFSDCLTWSQSFLNLFVEPQSLPPEAFDLSRHWLMTSAPDRVHVASLSEACYLMIGISSVTALAKLGIGDMPIGATVILLPYTALSRDRSCIISADTSGDCFILLL